MAVVTQFSTQGSVLFLQIVGGLWLCLIHRGWGGCLCEQQAFIVRAWGISQDRTLSVIKLGQPKGMLELVACGGARADHRARKRPLYSLFLKLSALLTLRGLPSIPDYEDSPPPGVRYPCLQFPVSSVGVISS